MYIKEQILRSIAIDISFIIWIILIPGKKSDTWMYPKNIKIQNIS